MAERPSFRDAGRPLPSTLGRREVERCLLALARDADRDQGLTYGRYLERIDTLRLVARELGLDCAEDIRVSVARGSSVRVRTPDPE